MSKCHSYKINEYNSNDISLRNNLKVLIYIIFAT